MRKPCLAWCSPHYGPVSTAVHKSHMAAIANASRTFDIKFIGVTDKMNLHSACNVLAKESLMSGVDYIFWAEMDMVLPFDCITKLYENNKAICAGLYFLRNVNFMPCMWKLSPIKKHCMSPIVMFKENEVMQVDVPGMGCVLYKSDVFRQLDEPWFEKIQEIGQDVTFYQKVKDAGIDVFVDTKVQCGQIDEHVTSIDDYRKNLLANTSNLQGYIDNDKV